MPRGHVADHQNGVLLVPKPKIVGARMQAPAGEIVDSTSFVTSAEWTAIEKSTGLEIRPEHRHKIYDAIWFCVISIRSRPDTLLTSGERASSDNLQMSRAQLEARKAKISKTFYDAYEALQTGDVDLNVLIDLSFKSVVERYAGHIDLEKLPDDFDLRHFVTKLMVFLSIEIERQKTIHSDRRLTPSGERNELIAKFIKIYTIIDTSSENFRRQNCCSLFMRTTSLFNSMSTSTREDFRRGGLGPVFKSENADTVLEWFKEASRPPRNRGGNRRHGA